MLKRDAEQMVKIVSLRKMGQKYTPKKFRA